MRLVLIILKLLLTPAYFVNTSGIQFADPNSTYCQNGWCIKKCCPENLYLKRNECVPYPKNDFKITLPVYDVYDSILKRTEKQVQDVFVFNANAFENENLKQNNFDVSTLGFEAYIADRGILYLRSQMDGEIEKWRSVSSDDYCLDYAKRRSSTVHIWANMLQVKNLTWPMHLYGEEYTTQHTTEHTTEYATEYITETRHATKYEYFRITKVQKNLGTIIACVFLSIVLMVYSTLMPEKAKFENWVLIAYGLSVLLAFIFFIILQTMIPIADSCIFSTCAVFFFYLTCFCWMNVMSFDIWWTFRGYLKARPIHRRSERSKFALCCLYALGLPSLMTIGLFVLAKLKYYRSPWFVILEIPQRGCFVTAVTELLHQNIPTLILTLVSWVFLLMAWMDVRRLGKGLAAINSELTGSPVARRMQFLRLLLYLKLSTLMTLTLIVKLGIFVMGVMEDVVTDKLYLFLGFGIFVVLVCKKEIFMKLTESCRNSKANPNAETLVTKSTI